MSAATPAEGDPVRVFVGSSGEGIDVAHYLQAVLEERANCEVTIWNQGVFEPSGFALDSLLEVAAKSDFAVLIATPDDEATHRGQQSSVPRDNVMLELGLFLGSLGRTRTFLLPPTREIRLPSDVFGLTTLPYRHRTDGNMRAAVSSAATAIAERIRTLGHHTPAAVQPEAPEPAVSNTALAETRNAQAPFHAGDGAVANRVAMGEAVSAIASNLGVLRAEAFWAVERLKEGLGVASHAELAPVLRAAGFGATNRSHEPWDGLLLSLQADRGSGGEVPRQPDQSVYGGSADHPDAAALGMEIEQLCTNARAQGWVVKTNNETTLKLVPPGARRKAHTLR